MLRSLFVAKNFLDSMDVVACFKQMCGKGMPEGMVIDMLYHSGIGDSFFHGPLKNCFMCMMAPFLAGF